MSNVLRAVNRITIAGGATLLLLSLWPGFVVGCFLVLAYPLILALGVTWLVVVIVGTRNSAAVPLSARAVLVAPIVVSLTYGALLYYIPRRIAFAACKGGFERCLSSASTQPASVPVHCWLGIYRVTEIAADERGGVYFQTGTTADGLGIDTLTYGFAYKPNGQGSPFGAARYQIHPLSGDWCWFQASNDWY